MTVTRRLPIRAEQAWALLSDLRNHPRWIPWTRVDAPNRPVVGSTVSTSSGPRSAALVDRMVVERSDPPWTAQGVIGVARYRKLGPVLLGSAELRVRPVDDATCEVTWVEDVHLRGTPPTLTRPLLNPFLWVMLRVALRRLHAEVGAGRGARE